MTRTLTAIVLAASTALAAPAMAGGTITFGYSAKNQDEANLMRLGMAIYTLGKDHHDNGQITEGGVRNAVDWVNPNTNTAYTEQNGNNHNGSMTMNGGGTKCALIQHGNGANNHVHAGSGDTCIVLGIGLD